MKIVLSLLQDFISFHPGIAVPQITAALIQLGHEVDGVHTTGANFPNVVVGKVLERIPHPNADKLGVCTVDAGEGQPRQIVCGAPNARAGITVAVALPGAVLPGDFKIKVSKIRDVESCGMLCSKRELGLGTEHEGIWELTAPLPVGTPLSETFGPGETVLEVSLTPNRGDCFSHLGLARDLAALNLGTLTPLASLGAGTGQLSVQAQALTPACPQLNLIEVKGLTNQPSPPHVQSRLEAAGLRPKNMLVDATNYTMIALGQPLHAYDATRINGTLRAAAARGGESYSGLGDVTLTLAADDIIIADDNGILGLGGILGSSASAVTDTTTHVVLEAAVFDRIRISLTGQAHQLHTDARQRFERGIDPALTQHALLFCAHLIVQTCGGQLSTMVTAGQGVAAPQPISYSPSFFNTFIGMDIPAERQKSILQALGFGVSGTAEWQITPPTWRTYMSTPEDLTEEILRVVGYDQVTPQLPAAMPAQTQVDGAPITLDRTARKALAASGFLEVLTYSFIGQNVAQQFAAGASLITLANPLAQTDMTTLRPSLLPGLLTALKGNFAKSESTPRLAEVGKTFTAKAETLMAAGILTTTGQRHWSQPETAPTPFTAKAAALQVLGLLGAPVESATVKAFGPHNPAPAAYHPGRSGSIQVGPFTLATFGQLHPAIAKQFDVPATTCVFELMLEPLLKLQSKPRPWQPTPYPPVHRDLAFLLAKSTTAAEVLATIRAANRTLLKQVEVFDMYQGDKIAADKQSIAFSLTLQSPDKTLAEADVIPVIDSIVQAVQTAHHATLRA